MCCPSSLESLGEAGCPGAVDESSVRGAVDDFEPGSGSAGGVDNPSGGTVDELGGAGSFEDRGPNRRWQTSAHQGSVSRRTSRQEGRRWIH